METENGIARTDFIFDQIHSVSSDELKNRAIDLVMKRKLILPATVMSAAISPNQVTATAAPTHMDSYNWTFRNAADGNKICGTYTSNVDYYREGTSTLNGVEERVLQTRQFVHTDLLLQQLEQVHLFL